jgi:hypothetical protein
MKTTQSVQLTSAEVGTLCTSFEKKFPVARCWFEPFPGRVYVRYATGFSEHLSIPQLQAMLEA